MRSSLPRALELLRGYEGGYVDHPSDPGGCTNLGITLATYRAHGHPHATCRELRALTWESAAAIYRAAYWDAVGADALPAGLDLCVFDAAVHSGPGQAKRWLPPGAAISIDAYCDLRLAFLRRLPTWKTFGRGWARRVNDLRAAAHALAAAEKKSREPTR